MRTFSTSSRAPDENFLYVFKGAPLTRAATEWTGAAGMRPLRAGPAAPPAQPDTGV